MSSNNSKKSRKKKLNQENESISTFIDKKSFETDEPLTKKNKVAEDSNADDSLKFFKNVQTKIKSVKPSTSSSSSTVSDFINKPSTSKQTKKAQKPKSKRIAKPKAQTDIRKALSKQDRLLYHAINESCTEDGVDPYEMQLALAISESLKDINKDEQPSTSKEQVIENKHLDNPFSSTGKIQSITTVLERYGFKSKKVYSDYEIEMIMNNKSSKRSKYQKFPTLLTSTSEDKRNDMIRSKINDVLESILFAEIEYRDFPTFNPIVYSNYLESLYENHNTIFSKSSTENMILNDYYITNLFEPSNVKAGHLLKDWNKIVGRDPSPVKEVTNKKVSLDIQELEKVETDIIDKESIEGKDSTQLVSLNSSCSDIFEGVESFTLDQSENSQEVLTNKSVNDHLNLLHEKLSQSVVAPENLKENLFKNDDEVRNTERIFLTQDDSMQSDATQEYKLPDEIIKENEIFDLTQEKDCTTDGNLMQPVEQNGNENDDIYDLTQYESPKHSSMKDEEIAEPSSQIENRYSHHDVFDLTQQESEKESEIIDISDEEINYSINRFQANDEICEHYSNNCLSQSDGSSNDLMEIDNIAEHSLIEVIENDDYVKIDNSVSELLTNFSDYRKSTSSFTRKNRSMRLIENEIFNDSITDIMKKYGVLASPAPSKSFSKIHSESNLEKLSQPSMDKIKENVDLTIINDKSNEENESIIEEEGDLPGMNLSINKSLANILKSPMIKQNAVLSKPKARKSLGIVMNEKYVVDTENLFIEPDFPNMTPLELKQELFKYGIRTLPVKKAVELIKHIYDQLHPKIRIAIDEEIDLDDTRRAMNITDVITDIGMKGDEDEFVFKLNDCGILEGEEYILPKMKKSKVPSCLVPLHISFYNMIRSNDKLQKYILEYRPLDLDQIYKHFRKFDLTYQLNDIIAFLDKRCITFKTKEQSYSKKHERKKQKRTQSQ